MTWDFVAHVKIPFWEITLLHAVSIFQAVTATVPHAFTFNNRVFPPHVAVVILVSAQRITFPSISLIGWYS